MAYLRALGRYLPARIVTNTELGSVVQADPAWILRATGIEERRFAAAEQSVADLGVLAARDCLETGGIEPDEIGFVVVASSSAERRFPGPASSIVTALGIAGTPAIDLPMASAGSLFGVVLAADLATTYRNVLVVGSEIMSRVVARNPAAVDTAILFGDGAGACVISSGPGFAEIAGARLASDGVHADALRLDLDSPLHMDGRTIILHAARKLPRIIRELLDRRDCRPDQVGTYLLHQANRNLITRVAQTLGVPDERFFCNLDRYGNTSSASLLIAAAEWRRHVRKMEAPAVLAAFGAGLHWGAVLLEPCRVSGDNRENSPRAQVAPLAHPSA